jgi:hypothetical protein
VFINSFGDSDVLKIWIMASQDFAADFIQEIIVIRMIKIRQLLRCKFKINFGRFNFRAFSFGKNLIGNLCF